MSDDGWGDDDAGWTDGAGETAATPATGDEEVEDEKPRGGGDGKCRNCKQVTYSFLSSLKDGSKTQAPITHRDILGRALCFRLP